MPYDRDTKIAITIFQTGEDKRINDNRERLSQDIRECLPEKAGHKDQYIKE
jgi:hypothetical protein